MVEDNIEAITRFISGTDLAVAAIYVNKTCMDGDIVNITATIANIGRKNSTNFTVKFWEIYYSEVADRSWYLLKPKNYSTLIKLINTTLPAGTFKNISVNWSARVKHSLHFEGERAIGTYEHWNEIAYNYTIKVEILPFDNPENNLSNNQKETRVHVDVSRDFSISNVSFIVNGKPHDPKKLVVGMNVTLNATVNVTNLACLLYTSPSPRDRG